MDEIPKVATRENFYLVADESPRDLHSRVDSLKSLGELCFRTDRIKGEGRNVWSGMVDTSEAWRAD